MDDVTVTSMEILPNGRQFSAPSNSLSGGCFLCSITKEESFFFNFILVQMSSKGKRKMERLQDQVVRKHDNYK